MSLINSVNNYSQQTENKVDGLSVQKAVELAWGKGFQFPLAQERRWNQFQVVHIGQFHGVDDLEMVDGQTLRAVAKSQLKVIETIRSYPGALVHDEGLYEDLEPGKQKHSRKAQKLFANGIPESVEELSAAQMDFLYVHGGAYTLNALGEIPLYKTAHLAFGRYIEQLIADGREEYIFEPREREALQCIVETVQKQCDPSSVSIPIALLNLGEAHDIGPICAEFGVPCTRIDTTDPETWVDSSECED